MFRLSVTVVALGLFLRLFFVVLRVTSWPIVKTSKLVMGELLSVEPPQDVLEVEGSVLFIDQHHRRQMVIGVEVLKRKLKKAQISS